MEGAEAVTSAQMVPDAGAVAARVLDYVAAVASKLVLEGTELDGGLAEHMLKMPGSQEALFRFVQDARCPVLYFETFNASDGKVPREPKYNLSLDVGASALSHGHGTSGVAFIKRAATPIEDATPVASQLQVITLGPGVMTDSEAPANAVLALLQQYTKHSFAPLVKAFAAEAAAGKVETAGSTGPSGSGKVGNNSTSLLALLKKLTELELVLAQCQEAVKIPSVELSVHADIARAAGAATTDVSRVVLEEVGLGEKLRDDVWLNSLQSLVNQWVKDIQRVTRLTDTPFPDTAIEEVNFWRSLEEALRKVEVQLDAPAVRLTVRVLKQARRLIAVAALENNTGLDSATKTVADVLSFLRDMPINSLMSASTVDQLSGALTALFQHMMRLKNSKYYDLERAGKLLESFSRAFAHQVKALLAQRQSMRTSYDEFVSLKREMDGLFGAWRAGSRRFDEMFVDLWKKRIRSLGPGSTTGTQALKNMQANLEHLKLQSRVDEIATFRTQHQRFCQVIEAVLSGEDGEALRDIDAAYARFLSIDVLDVTPEGKQPWQLAQKAYDQRIDRLEDRVIRILCDRLSSTKTAEEMFRVFSKFKPLFFRPRIRAAIAQFQADLIKHVRDAVQMLQEKFTERYEASEARMTAMLRDLPPVAGKILWARQIERQLRLLMQRMEDVLGTGWEKHVEGRQLKGVCDELLRNLDTDSFFRKWIKDVEEDLTSGTKRERLRMHLFLIRRDRHGEACLQVNFEESTVMLFKEVRNLTWLGFKVPVAIRHLADEASERYPYAMALQATLRTLAQTQSRMTPEMEPLLSGHVKAVRDVVGEAFVLSKGKYRMKWDSPELPRWVVTLSERVFALQEKTDDLMDMIKEADAIIKKLQDCAYDTAVLESHMGALQKVIDDLNLAGYGQIDRYVEHLEECLQKIFLQRLTQALESWIAAFKVVEPTADRRRPTLNTPKATTATVPPITMSIHLQPQYHEIVLQNQTLFLSPPLQSARARWTVQLHGYLGTICNLPRLKSSRFDVFGSTGASVDGEGATYADMARRLPKELLYRAYEALQALLSQATAYVREWLQYQTLWDMDSQLVYDRIGTDLQLWVQLLTEMKTARSLIENSQTEKSFGPLVVDYTQIQGKVNLKYDAWQKEFQGRFGAILSDAVRDTHRTLTAAKARLEATALEGASKDVITGVTFIQEMRQQRDGFQKSVGMLEAGEKLLQRQRFAFPTDWPQVSNVVGALEDFKQILDRRAEAMEQQIPALQNKVRAEDKALSKRVSDMAEEWAVQKPLQGNEAPRHALEILTAFESQATRSRADFDRLSAAKAALGLDVALDDPLKLIEDEVRDLKEVWGALLPTWDGLQALRDTAWGVVVPRKLRQGLEELTEHMRALPNRVRQYEAFVFLQQRIRGYQSVQTVVSDLKSDALKDRHWRGLLKRLNVKAAADLTLGHLWEADLLANKAAIQEVLATAQGEMALEQFLRQVREHWVSCDLELVMYRNRVRLIKGWDVLFAKLDEHLNSLATMKLSPYFRAVQEFQEEAGVWDDRLSRVKTILDVWINVQRRWVYLEGIFLGSADIRAQLPAEYTRFKGIDTEFVQIMRKVAAKPSVLEILQIDNLLRQLERLEAFMNKIQKALGEYLKRQRMAFSRFYFTGDEDLLEIMGSTSEPTKVTPHLSKMFAALASVQLKQNGGGGIGNQADDRSAFTLTSMISKEGEEVPLKDAITFGPATVVRDWLRKLEDGMRATLAALLQQAVEARNEDFAAWVESFPTQVITLAVQIWWSSSIESALSSTATNTIAKSPSSSVLNGPITELNQRLLTSVNRVLADVTPQVRKKFEQLITEFVHERDVTRSLISHHVSSPHDFKWLYHLRFQWAPAQTDVFQKLGIRMANASFFYGFEYLGIGERLVQTPLTDRCYLTLTQALHHGMGGNPFGPAGTGKTESVKALGAQLGRFVLVFNCDEHFDYSAMGRLFAGLCQVGAWGCFDEFNRLEERILSAVSQQILTIQRGLIQRRPQIDLLGEAITLHPNVGIFVTMNPGYAGRSNLPDNLKQLFRAVAMTAPDRGMIAQVMLFSQGIETAEELAGKIVLLFQLCEEQLSPQTHYDFGLRALKSVLVGAGALKRDVLSRHPGASMAETERSVLIMSICSTVVPKLVADDLPVFRSLLQGVFPGADVAAVDEADLRNAMISVCEQRCLVPGHMWTEKLLQLKQVLALRHGVMLVGPPASGKSAAWRVLLEAMATQANAQKGEAYVIDPKAIDKEHLYGTLDSTTLEWTDGVFTALLRQVLANVRGERDRPQWIVFDGDVDPEWAENLNSVLDDNRLLTLPSGERLEIPPNVRIIMEVDSLRYATLATVSRCGMVWFQSDTVTTTMILQHHLRRLKTEPVGGGVTHEVGVLREDGVGVDVPRAQAAFVAAIEPYVGAEEGAGGPVTAALKFALSEAHIMEVERMRLIETFFSLLTRGVALAVEYDEDHPDFPMSNDHIEGFAGRWLLFSALWAFGSSLTGEQRDKLSDLLAANTTLAPPTGASIVDMQVRIDDGQWVEWSSSVPRLEIESHRVVSSDVVVPTTDTLRHVEVLRAWLASHRPLILCGPPGSGKTMTLTSTLQAMPQLILASLNFSSGTGPELILKTFAQYCEYTRTPRGVVLQPMQSLGTDKWLVIFCDEINLPEADRYGTQRVIAFLRQLVEANGFWRADNTWVTLSRIQVVGACNPPTDAGRTSLSLRFLRHAPLLYVDYPTKASLRQIYRTFNAALLKLHPQVAGYIDPITDAMVDYYTRNQSRFTADQQPQYVYSPRELSRWVRALYEAIGPLDSLSAGELVRVWAHEALRLFHDRLTTDEEREWCQQTLDEVATEHFSGVAGGDTLQRPILYSKWLSKHYKSVSREELKDFIGHRLKVFYEEELDVPLVVHNEVLDHVLRIDAVLRQPIGHLLLIGESGMGKTVLSRFVSWMNGLSIFQVKASNQYTLANFDDDLRAVLKRSGAHGERICFIFDESNALSSAFLERMNALLASGEVPGLFEGEELNALMAACRESASRVGGAMGLVDSDDEVYRRFVREVQRNLHVVFTLNPASGDFESRCSTSPALFNRCVVDWFGTWSTTALAQVAHEFTLTIDYIGSVPNYRAPPEASELMAIVQPLIDADCGRVSLHHAVIAALVATHNGVRVASERMSRRSSRRHYVSPRDFLDLIKKFVALVNEKRSQLEEQQLHINIGLEKLKSTQSSVEVLQVELGKKREELSRKDALANVKLQQMIADQNEAERRKSEADQVSVELDKQNVEIARRREEAERDLAEAEPALIAAQQSVKSIKKAQLDEVRALARPPNAVRLTLEAVLILLGEKFTDWNDIRKLIRKEDFISTVVNFEPEKVTTRQVREITDSYLKLDEFEYENVNRASKACGPLNKWVTSQLFYTDILRRVQPLRDEVAQLQVQSDMLQGQKDQIVAQITQLETSIARYKVEYAESIREIESIKTEMDAVSSKVRRAEALLVSLGSEKDRWHSTSTSFQQQLTSLIGDAVLGASFLTYAGVFDHRSRSVLLDQWAETLDTLGVPFRADLSPADYLSRPAQMLEWQSMGLPNDQLCLENATILERYNRYPLIIDPSGQATQFILQKYAQRKIQTTSFIDSAFLKTLASAVRFGTPLLITDVETIDPILNPVLNREVQRTGGRTIIRLGSEDIDYSPQFVVVLVTRNPLARFSPDLCSRVTLVNFTVTPASLRSQALSQILRSERPDVDRRRTELLRLQGEQNVRLRELEEGLLNELSAVQGNILDDDRVIRALEDLKAEAAVVGREAASTVEVMAELKSISDTYEPLALAVSQLYFTLECLSKLVPHLYQYSIQYLLRILAYVLTQHPPPTAPTTDRVPRLHDAILSEVVRRVSKGLLQEDQVAFAVRVVQIAIQGDPTKELDDVELDYLLRGAPLLARAPASTSTTTINKDMTELIPGAALNESQAKELRGLSLLPAMASLIASIRSRATEWGVFMSSARAEACVPDFDVSVPVIGGWRVVSSKGLGKERRAFLELLVIRALRRDRTMAALELYVSAVLGDGFPWRGNFDLEEVVRVQSVASSPLLLCSETGHDASQKVDALADSQRVVINSVAMGSEEGYDQADRMISSAAQQGTWVLLRNIHLCPTWLEALEKRLHKLSSTLDPRFRLFLTSEIHPKLPPSLVRLCDVMMVEAPTGVKANVYRMLSGVSAQRAGSPPAEKTRLFFLTAWFHAVIQERLRYVPLGWSKRYEFSQADAQSALEAVERWVDSVAGRKAHVSPEAIPWEALRTLLSQSIYGGRVDNPFDQSVLDSFVDRLFNAKCFDVDFKLVDGEDALVIPDCVDQADYLSWIQSLPNSNSPTWLGLPPTVEGHMLTTTGTRVVSKVMMLQDVLSEDQGGAAVSASPVARDGGKREEGGRRGSAAGGVATKGGKLKALLGAVEGWLDAITKACGSGASSSTTKSHQDLLSSSAAPLPHAPPVVDLNVLQRCVYREVEVGRTLITRVEADIRAAASLLKGELKATKGLRALVNALAVDTVPSEWTLQHDSAPKTLGAGAWVMDVCKRVKHGLELWRVVMPDGGHHRHTDADMHVWLGGLFYPQAFITATRQATAERCRCSLQDLHLSLSVNDRTEDNTHQHSGGGRQREGAYAITGLTLEGATWEDGALKLSSAIHCVLPLAWLSWRPSDAGGQETASVIRLPIYMNENRTTLVCEVELPKPDQVPDYVLAQRGVALTAWVSDTIG